MSSTLCLRPVPIETPRWSFKLPVKGIIARKYYDHDGSLGGGLVVLTIVDLPWFEGVLAAASGLDKSEKRELEEIIETLRRGRDLEMWFEV